MWTILLVIWCGLGLISYLYILLKAIKNKKKLSISVELVLLAILLIFGIFAIIEIEVVKKDKPRNIKH